jgi:amino acid transporter
MAQQARKFGAFSGVFTPSILTILGVIMYMRLGWVTGVAGFWGVILIILLAHVISLTTGLSISSIATDKKIEAGGIYYILSRSLGLPIGGSIGITLFIGTALSISMYIVGFTENFLALPVITDFLNIDPLDINTVRIIGTSTLIVLIIIALISTNIAIKAQFFILGAIFLSLISIAVGFFLSSPESAVEQVEKAPPFMNYSFEVVFAIFFPAVTGFTAGVALSGDLKDPKKDIPRGTMLAIFTGLVVYLALGIGFYFFVDQQMLLNDYNFLLTMAWLPVLVIAGIWGATLSSALGGILGGPRIIQAVALDRIVPSILGKGQGVNNEPRNALIFTFMLAEVGILIGDLNVIARVVTMFYLTAYGFINLAFALEKWASSDFRPSFRISLWIGIIGFLACFFIMFELDVTAMVAALVILTFIYVYISRKNLHLDVGDVWPSVTASLLRKILTAMASKKLTERNWRANILLFSGGTENRPHLISFGKWLVGRHGLISNFDLVEHKYTKVLIPKTQQYVQEETFAKAEGIFSRRQDCNDIYEGIETIAATYGFSGVEPNTVVLGWGRKTTNPLRFAQVIKYLSDMDLNVVILDYNQKNGFGNHDSIDIWWRGGSNNGNLILSLIKFIRISYEWRNTRVRLLLVNPVNEKKDLIEKQSREVLDKMRMDAEIKVINNEKDKLPINTLIRKYSSDTDLTFLGLPDVVSGQEDEFVKRTGDLYKDLGTIVLVKASSFFSVLHIGDV